MKKKMRLVTILGSAALCLGLSGGILATANGCGEKEPPKKVTYTFDFNGAATAIIDQNYNPKITVGDNTTIVSVTLRNDGGVEIPLNGDYTFTPTHFGDYYYNIVVETDGVENTYVEKVSVLDVTAPVVTEKPTTKTVDLGLYGNFEKDLEQFIVSDNNAEMLGYVTKKAVAITYGGKTEENANGYSEYLFKKVGKYTVKVAITDVAGNVAYSQYEINAQDKVAPAINVFGVYYAWQNTDGTVTLPSVNVNEYSNYECTVSAMRNGQTLTQTDGKVTASVGDVLMLTYTATDEYANSATATTKLKVLEKGKLFDGADAEIETLFTSSNGMIEYADGSVIAQMGHPDMREAIQFAFSYPHRLTLNNRKLNFAELGSLSFQAPDIEKFPALGLAYEALDRGGNMPCVMNAANEAAVAAFLQERISFYDITAVVEECMNGADFASSPDLDTIFRTNEVTLRKAEEAIKTRQK